MWKFFGSAHANFFKRDFLNFAWAELFSNNFFEFVIKFPFDWYMYVWGFYASYWCFRRKLNITPTQFIFSCKIPIKRIETPCIHISIERKFYEKFKNFIKKIIPPTQNGENYVWKNLRGRNPKFFISLNSKLNLLSKDMYESYVMSHIWVIVRFLKIWVISHISWVITNS